MADLNPITKDKLHQGAEVLLEARRTKQPVAELPPALRPATLEEAYYLQDVIAGALGTIGGWKVGAPSPAVTPLFAPMPLLGGFAGNGHQRKHHRYRGVEAEIAFLLGRDLPPRSEPYSRDEIVASIASCHPAIEILEPGFADPDKVERLSMIGDLQMTGGFAYGEAVPGWPAIDIAEEAVTMTVDGVIRVEGKGSNPAGSDLIRLVQWLANEAAFRTGGLKAGQWITTGSWTGKTCASPGSVATAAFAHFGSVTIRFA